MLISEKEPNTIPNKLSGRFMFDQLQRGMRHLMQMYGYINIDLHLIGVAISKNSEGTVELTGKVCLSQIQIDHDMHVQEVREFKTLCEVICLGKLQILKIVSLHIGDNSFETKTIPEVCIEQEDGSEPLELELSKDDLTDLDTLVKMTSCESIDEVLESVIDTLFGMRALHTKGTTFMLVNETETGMKRLYFEAGVAGHESTPHRPKSPVYRISAAHKRRLKYLLQFYSQKSTDIDPSGPMSHMISVYKTIVESIKEGHKLIRYRDKVKDIPVAVAGL